MVKLRSSSGENQLKKEEDSDDPMEDSDKPNMDKKTKALTNSMKALEFRHLHKVFYISRELISNRDDVIIVPLRNPCTGLTSRYICQHNVGRYYEIMKYCEPNRSWFVDEVLTIDGAIFMTTLVDPLFLILPYIQRDCRETYTPLDNVLKDERYTEIGAFVDAVSLDQLLLISDQKGPVDLKAIRYNEEKTLHWLAFKCHKFMKLLEEKKVYVEGGAKSETYVKSEKLQTDPDNDALLSYCIEVINEYIPRDMREKLLDRLGAKVAKPSTSTSHKRKPTSEAEKASGTQKRLKDDSSSDSPPATPKVEEKKVTAREKALNKAAAGTKNIMSFFKKK